ncbi:MAG: GTP-binding protein [Candidatus Micrarchaeota archaeon]
MAGKKVIIMGAAGRDYHDFNTCFRDNAEYEVVAFTQAPEQNLSEIGEEVLRVYPPVLAGKLYPNGIPTYHENKMPELVKKLAVDEVVFSYSDNSHEFVMHRASEAIAAGADFRLIGTKRMQIASAKPVIGVNAVRTGCGKSQTTRRIAEILKAHGRKVVVIREPMPYGDLAAQAVQRFAKYQDMIGQGCTVEEMEEYEAHIEAGTVVYAGVDYEKIIRQAEKECDVVLWDGGNNELSFYKTDLLFVVADPHRTGHETRYHPGEANLRAADIVIINKVDTAKPSDVEQLKKNIKAANPRAQIVEADSPAIIAGGADIRGKKVLVIDDGPTLTHGGMKYGAGTIAAQKAGAVIVDPRPYAKGTVAHTFAKYTHLDKVLPAMGYSKAQLQELQDTINAAPVDFIVSGTPIDLGRLVKTNKPMLRVTYDLKEKGDALAKAVAKVAGV